MMKRISNKRGEGYIFPCVLILVICMIFSVFLFFYSAASMVRITKENTETVFDSYIMKNSIEIYDSIKQGNDFTETLDQNVYIDDLCRFCSLAKGSYYLYAYGDDGKLKYRITRPTISFQEDNSLKIQLQYTLYLPIWFNGRVARYAVIPVTVNSSLSEKF